MRLTSYHSLFFADHFSRWDWGQIKANVLREERAGSYFREGNRESRGRGTERKTGKEEKQQSWR